MPEAGEPVHSNEARCEHGLGPNKLRPERVGSHEQLPDRIKPRPALRTPHQFAGRDEMNQRAQAVVLILPLR
jgi:hypothetical protein